MIRKCLSYKVSGSSLIGGMLPILFSVLFGAILIAISFDVTTAMTNKRDLDSVLTQYTDGLISSNETYNKNVIEGMINAIVPVEEGSLTVKYTRQQNSAAGTLHVDFIYSPTTNILALNNVSYKFERQVPALRSD